MGDGGGGEFVTVFGVNGFAWDEVQGEGGAGGVGGDDHGLPCEGFEVHFDTGVGGVPAGLVTEVGEAEVGSKVAVEAGEEIEIEGSGDTGGVVVGAE